MKPKAGFNKVIPHDQLDLIESEFLQKIFAVNLFGPLWLSTAAMPHLQKSEDVLTRTETKMVRKYACKAASACASTGIFIDCFLHQLCSKHV
eukprot:6463699-Amphidinium_carterae.1